MFTSRMILVIRASFFSGSDRMVLPAIRKIPTAAQLVGIFQHRFIGGLKVLPHHMFNAEAARS